ncbi:MAG: nucleotidyltransferase domain-containing protein [Chloroflexota bacterium]
MVALQETTLLKLPYNDLTWQQHLQAELRRILPLLISHYKPLKVILFGSSAKGQAHLWSDIDLIVVANTPHRFLDRTKEALLLVKPQVGLDVFIYTPEEFDALCRERPFFQNEVLTGKLLYEYAY